MKPFDAAMLLGKSPMWVRIGLRNGTLPIGAAIRCPGGRWSYDIRPERLAQYMGINVAEMHNRLETILNTRTRYATQAGA